MNKGAIIFSILVATIISIILAFSIFGILYFHWGDIEAVKNSLSTVSSFFGGFATLGAAIIAAYLFNDWRVQHNKDIENQFIKNAIDSFNIVDHKAAFIDIKFNDFKALYNCEIYAINEYPFNSFEEKYLDPLIAEVSDLKLELAKLSNFYQLYSSLYEHKMGDFESITKDMQKILYLSNFLRNGFGDKFNYLDKVFLPEFKNKIGLLEEDYIKSLIPKLKALI